MKRTERDSLGEIDIPADALYGIHSQRASINFPCETPFHIEWYKAIGFTKLACYRTYRKFREATLSKHGADHPLQLIDEKRLKALEQSATEVSEGLWFSHFIVPAIQGGAGTSINMNINEIITNAALVSLDHQPGLYDIIDPIEHANIYQSTNDVIPTGLTVAAMLLLQQLEESINDLRQGIELHENGNRDKLRPAYTQMQEAVPASFGQLFSTYNEALSRDWWRVSKCKERIKTINLGGGATGSGLGIPRFFIMEVVPELRNIAGVPVSRSENLFDTTSNLDSWVEIHGTLKAHAVNLEKIASDIRLLSSDIAGKHFINIPSKQVGSSIMPGKVNPVISEYLISVAHKVYSNDSLVSSLCGQGSLDLNAYIPTIGNAILETIKLLKAANNTLLSNMITGMSIDESAGYKALMMSPSITTALSPTIGYNSASKLAKLMKERGVDIFTAANETGLIDSDSLKIILEPGNLLKLGFTLADLKEIKGK
jgi:aspartate ammonia-lyase